MISLSTANREKETNEDKQLRGRNRCNVRSEFHCSATKPRIPYEQMEISILLVLRRPGDMRVQYVRNLFRSVSLEAADVHSGTPNVHISDHLVHVGFPVHGNPGFVLLEGEQRKFHTNYTLPRQV